MHAHRLVSRSLLACAAVGLVACSSAKEERGLRYMPDMYQSPAYKAQEAMVVEGVDKDGNPITREVPSMLPYPAGTVARDGQAPYDLTDEQLEEADQRQNPLVADAATLRLGRDKYDTYCAVCHGRDGIAANGYVAKALLGAPNLASPVVKEYTDGRLYHFITLGKNRMPNYRAQLLPEERWAVIHYVRALNTAKDRADDPALQGKGDDFRPLPEPKPEYAAGEWPSVGGAAKGAE